MSNDPSSGNNGNQSSENNDNQSYTVAKGVAGGSNLYNYNTRNLDTGKRVYAATVSVTDGKGFMVAGNRNDASILGLGLNARVGVIYSKKQTKKLERIGDISEDVSFNPNDATLEAQLNSNSTEGGAIFYAGKDTVNGVTRKYGANGGVIEETDARTHTRTVFNNHGKPVAVYSLENAGEIIQSFNYNKSGHLESMVSYDKEAGYVTSFFLGFGSAQVGQTQVQVLGDQSKNAGLMASLWDTVVNNNTSINDAAQKNPSFKGLVASISKIVINTRDILEMTDVQLSHIFGWNPDSPNITATLSNIRTSAQTGNYTGRLTVEFNADAGKGLSFAMMIEIYGTNNAQEGLYFKDSINRGDAK